MILVYHIHIPRLLIILSLVLFVAFPFQKLLAFGSHGNNTEFNVQSLSMASEPIHCLFYVMDVNTSFEKDGVFME